MNWLIYSGFALFLLGIVSLIWKQSQLQKQLQQQRQEQKDNSTLLILQQQLEAMREQMNNQSESQAHLMQKHLSELNQQINSRLKDSNHLMHESQKSVGSRLDQAAKVVGDLQGKLGRLEEANKRLIAVGQDVRSLQDILKTPKLRGSLGEHFLADLLAQVLPSENFSLQHSFKNNEKVDAVVNIGQQLVSIDAKFPLENFQRMLGSEVEAEKNQFRKQFISDVKKHIDAISQKYIRPAENTFDFALMYVPAENIYYEVIVKDELSQQDHLIAHYAMKKKVIPVSPNTLYVYLHTIVLGLKGLRVEKAAQEILKGLSTLSNDLGRVQNDFRKIGVHLQHAQGAFENTEGRLRRFGERMEKLHGQPQVLGEEIMPSDQVQLISAGAEK